MYLNNEAGMNFAGDVEAVFDGESGSGAFLEGEGGTGVSGEKSGTACEATGVAISSASGRDVLEGEGGAEAEGGTSMAILLSSSAGNSLSEAEAAAAAAFFEAPRFEVDPFLEVVVALLDGVRLEEEAEMLSGIVSGGAGEAEVEADEIEEETA